MGPVGELRIVYLETFRRITDVLTGGQFVRALS